MAMNSSKLPFTRQCEARVCILVPLAVVLAMTGNCTNSRSDKTPGILYYEALSFSRIPVIRTEVAPKGKPTGRYRVRYRPGKIIQYLEVTREQIDRAANEHPQLVLRAHSYQTAFELACRVGRAVGAKHRDLEEIIGRRTEVWALLTNYEEYTRFERKLETVGWRVLFNGRRIRVPHTRDERTQLDNELRQGGAFAYFMIDPPEPVPLDCELSKYEDAWTEGWGTAFQDSYHNSSRKPPSVPRNFVDYGENWEEGWRYGFHYGYVTVLAAQEHKPPR